MKVVFYYNNLDNFMGTKQQASVTLEIAADDFYHTVMLADHLKNVLGADNYKIEE